MKTDQVMSTIEKLKKQTREKHLWCNHALGARQCRRTNHHHFFLQPSSLPRGAPLGHARAENFKAERLWKLQIQFLKPASCQNMLLLSCFLYQVSNWTNRVYHLWLHAPRSALSSAVSKKMHDTKPTQSSCQYDIATMSISDALSCNCLLEFHHFIIMKFHEPRWSIIKQHETSQTIRVHHEASAIDFS